MSDRTLEQRKRLLHLANTIIRRRESLGVGIENHCWAGVAIDIATQNGYTIIDYYGLSTEQVNRNIMQNNLVLPPASPHRREARRTFAFCTPPETRVGGREYRRIEDV